MAKTVTAYADAGYVIPDPYCIYVAFVPLSETEKFIKVGMSLAPLERLYAIHCSCPLPVEKALWTCVGSKEQARAIEIGIQERLRRFRTRGEWFLINVATPDDLATFEAACHAGVKVVTNKLMKWREASAAHIIEIGSERAWGSRRRKTKKRKNTQHQKKPHNIFEVAAK